jgi:hypothetical protein
LNFQNMSPATYREIKLLLKLKPNEHDEMNP